MAPVITPADRAPLSEQHDLVSALRRVSMFQHCSEASLLRLAMDMERVEFHPGDRVGPREGEPQSHLFVVTAGQLARWSRGRMIHDGPGGTLRGTLSEEEAVDMVRGDDSDEDGDDSDDSDDSDDDSEDGEGALSQQQQQQQGREDATTNAKEKQRQEQGQGRGRGRRRKRRGRERRRRTPYPHITVRAHGAGAGRTKSTVEVVSPDFPGLLATVSATLKSQGVSINEATVRTTRSTDAATTTAPKKGDKADDKGAKAGGGAEAGSAANGAEAPGGRGLLGLFRGTALTHRRIANVAATKTIDNAVQLPIDGDQRFIDSNNVGVGVGVGESSSGDVVVVEHTAYQLHEVVNAATNKPIHDPAWMRRVEAAVRVALVKAAAAHRVALEESDWDTNLDATANNTVRSNGNRIGGMPPAGAEVKTIEPGGSYMARHAVANAFGILQCLGSQPSYATTTAITSGVCWRLSSEKLERALRTGWSDADRDFAVDVASGLAAEVARMGTFYSTPLLDQPVQTINVAAVAVAAAFESYYRSALNAYLNHALSSAISNSATGGAAGKGAALPTATTTTFTTNNNATAGAANAAARRYITIADMFPSMHVQIPTRVLYINGFKLSRQYLAKMVDEPAKASRDRGDETMHNLYMLVPALLPGVLMTPISSILEACNAGHANPEPLYRRWIRGVYPRTAREIIFGLGLNNLTDWSEERIPYDVCETKVMRNALGSLIAGVISGYFSHVPHNLSTMKLLAPDKSYKEHVSSLIQSSSKRVPASLPPPVRDVAATLLALVLPKGLTIRTTQVIGSFILLNGISHLLDQR